MTMEASTTSFTPPGTVTFTLKNTTETTFGGGWGTWQLWKRVGGRWHFIAPPFRTSQATGQLEPGERHAWRVTMDNDAHRGDTVSGPINVHNPTISALGEGEYAFLATGPFLSDPDEYETAFGVTFDLDGEPLTLTTDGYIEDVSVDGTQLAARWTAHRDDPEARSGTYRLTRVADKPCVEPLIAEQIVRHEPLNEPLRDAFALIMAHDVREVRLRGKTQVQPHPFGVTDRLVAYNGATYRVFASE